MIAPFVPFMAENFFQELRSLVGKTQWKSVHLKRLPHCVWKRSTDGQAGLEMIEALIEARGELRSKVLKSAKKPLKKQFIFVSDWRMVPLLDDIQEILMKECNTLEIEFSANYWEVLEKTYQVSMPNLGKRFKKNAKEVKTQIDQFMNEMPVEKLERLQTGKILIPINGNLTEFSDEIQLSYKLDGKKISKIQENLYQQYFPDRGLVILSDLTWNTKLQEIYWLRVLSRKLMQFRKDMNLVPTHKAVVHYENKGETKLIENNLNFLMDYTNMRFVNILDNEKYSRNGKIMFEEDEIIYDLTMLVV